MLNLTPRLNAVASLIKGGGFIADIGTDHAYLPIYLVQQGLIKGAVAADIGKGPLKNAEKSVIENNLTDKISLRLSDGLKEIAPSEVDEIVFAGMGGTLIAEKLKETPWVKNKSLHFVFQPQSRAEDLREFLYENGFKIHKEVAVHELNRAYIAFDASYVGVKVKYKYSDLFIGGLPKTEDSIKHLSNQNKRLKKKYEALIKKGQTEETKILLEIITDIEKFIN